jgi:diguanylate cyclase (GGDEF)-like protein
MHKDNDCQSRDFVLSVDCEGLIQNVMPVGSGASSHIGQPVRSIIADEAAERHAIFEKRLRDDGVVLNHKTVTSFSGTTCPGYMNGYRNGDIHVIIVLHEETDDKELLRRIMMINSNQVNEIRSISKAMSYADNEAYINISRLNNELLNSKRIIEKQNAELLNYNRLLRQMAIEDALTGCYNRRHFYDHVREHLLPSQKDDMMTLVMVDFNHFKTVNDRLGHDAGDRLLIAFVRIAKETSGGSGIVFRDGGDEFIILYDGLSEDEVDTMMKTIAGRFFEQSAIAGLSYGIVHFKECDVNSEHDINDLLMSADKRMYAHKRLMKRSEQSS